MISYMTSQYLYDIIYDLNHASIFMAWGFCTVSPTCLAFMKMLYILPTICIKCHEVGLWFSGKIDALQYAGQCSSPGNMIVYFVPFCVCIVIKKIHKMLHHVLWYHINISCVLFIRTEAPDRWYHTMVSFMISYMISLYEIIVWYHHMISQHLTWYHDDFYDIILYMIIIRYDCDIIMNLWSLNKLVRRGKRRLTSLLNKKQACRTRYWVCEPVGWRPARGITARISRLDWRVLKIVPMANSRQVNFNWF